MKKIIIITLLTALALALMMTGALAADADVPEHEHYAYCTNPGVCDYCGAETTTMEHYGLHGIMQDEEYHIESCSECGYTSDPVAHKMTWGSAIDSKYHYSGCALCWYVSTEVAPHVPYVVQAPDGHWTICEICGTTLINSDEHSNPKYTYIDSENCLISCDVSLV